MFHGEGLSSVPSHGSPSPAPQWRGCSRSLVQASASTIDRRWLVPLGELTRSGSLCPIAANVPYLWGLFRSSHAIPSRDSSCRGPPLSILVGKYQRKNCRGSPDFGHAYQVMMDRSVVSRSNITFGFQVRELLRSRKIPLGIQYSNKTRKQQKGRREKE